MRYKVRAPTMAAFNAIKDVLAHRTTVHAVSMKRLMFSIGDIDDLARHRVILLGASIEPDIEHQRFMDALDGNL